MPGIVVVIIPMMPNLIHLHMYFSHGVNIHQDYGSDNMVFIVMYS